MKDKEFDSVKMMRDIREKLSESFQDPEVEDQALAKIRKKYKIKTS